MKRRAFEELFLKSGTMYIGDAIPTPKYRRPVPPPPPRATKEQLTSIPDNNYESPIRMFQDEMTTRMENDVCKVVCSYGIDVDKDELAKALNYDRQQYENGFKDGVRKFAEMLREVTRTVDDDYSSNGTITYVEIDDIDDLLKELVGE